MITIDVNSPEAAWPPFLQWLAQQGVEPTRCTSISYDPETLEADVELFKARDRRRGTYSKKIKLTSAPPRRAGNGSD